VDDHAASADVKSKVDGHAASSLEVRGQEKASCFIPPIPIFHASSLISPQPAAPAAPLSAPLAFCPLSQTPPACLHHSAS
jgi:hypothetical protein